MQRAIDETLRRRTLQARFNEEHGIVPKTIKKDVAELLEISKDASEIKREKLTKAERDEMIKKLERDMREASKMLEFEYAAILRDRIIELRGQ